MLRDAKALETKQQAPVGWKFDPREFWLEEHGLIMEIPAPLPAGKYKVTSSATSKFSSYFRTW
jgi:hypothetical protein